MSPLLLLLWHLGLATCVLRRTTRTYPHPTYNTIDTSSYRPQAHRTTSTESYPPQAYSTLSTKSYPSQAYRTISTESYPSQAYSTLSTKSYPSQAYRTISTESYPSAYRTISTESYPSAYRTISTESYPLQAHRSICTESYHPQTDGTINSLLLSGYFDFYGLNDREYDLAFFEKTLERIRDEATEFDVDNYYEKFNILSNGTYLKYNGVLAPFENLAKKLLRISHGTVFEDLVKFNVANALSKQILYYLALKMEVDGERRTYFNDRKRPLTEVMEVLEISIIRVAAPYPYYHVRLQMDELRHYGGIYRKISEEEDWIEEQIRATLRSVWTR